MPIGENAGISGDVELLANASADVEKSEKSEVLDPKDEIVEVEEIPEETEEEITSDELPEEELETTDKEEKKKEYLPHERPAISAIKKEFPELFKKFPSLEHMYFREKEFTEVFPTVAEAKDAAEASLALEDFREDLFKGNGEKFVAALKDAKELDKFSGNFLSNLQKSDSETYWKAITPTFENLVRAFHREGSKRNDANLIASAENLSIYLFGDADVAQGRRTTIKEESKSDPKLDKERADFERTKYNDFNISVNENIFNGLKPLVDLSKTPLSKTMQELLSDKIIKEVDKAVSADASHMKYVNGLWGKAKGNYTSEIKSKIVTAYLERAKSLVPSIRRRLLSEVTDSPERSKEKQEKVEAVQSRREPGSQGKPSGSSVRVHSAKAVDWNKTSDTDFLNGNINLKRSK